MAFLGKKRKIAQTKVDGNKFYSLKEASSLIKDATTCKFDASVDLHIRLGVDPKKADQAIRGTVTLPHGTGKTKKVLVLCTPDKEAEARAAGADFVGLDEFVAKIEGDNVQVGDITHILREWPLEFIVLIGIAIRRALFGSGIL